jgi:apolipoprotein N-acyltransferase
LVERLLRNKLATISAALAAVLLSGALLCAVFPSYDLPFLAWVAFVPLFLVLARCRPAAAFILSFVWGVAFYTGIFFWLFDLPQYNVLHHALLGVYLCPLTGLFGWIFCLLCRRTGPAAALLAVPFTWVAQEYLRSNFFFLSLPWALLGHSQYKNPAVIQIAEFTGVYGVSFWIMSVNSALTALVFLLIKNRFGTALYIAPRRMLTWIAAAAALTIGLSVFGRVEIAQEPAGEEFKIAVIQPSINQEEKWDPKNASEIMRILAELTAAAAKDKPELIVWPETSTPKSISMDRRLYEQVRSIAAAANTPLLFGSAQLAKFKVGDAQSAKFKNSAYLVPARAADPTVQQYEKVRLLPFGEYLPHADRIPWKRLYVPDVQGYMPGNQFVVFNQGSAQFGVPICWENIFPDDVRRFVQGGAEFLVNITNEAWFGHSAAPHQFLSMNVFRAIENRVYVVRCANTGISCFIDTRGRVVSQVADAAGLMVGVRGFLTDTVKLNAEKTFFTRHGDLFAQLCAAVSVFILAAFIPGAWLLAHRRRNQ